MKSKTQFIDLSADQASLLRGRRYNRTKKAAHGRADRNFWGRQNDAPKTADRLAAQHGVSARTIERDGAFATAVENVKAADPDTAMAATTIELTKRSPLPFGVQRSPD